MIKLKGIVLARSSFKSKKGEVYNTIQVLNQGNNSATIVDLIDFDQKYDESKINDKVEIPISVSVRAGFLSYNIDNKKS